MERLYKQINLLSSISNAKLSSNDNILEELSFKIGMALNLIQNDKFYMVVI